MDKPRERTLSEAIPFWNDWTPDVEDDEDDDEGCPGHESLAGAAMGLTVYCDGSCTTRR